MLQVKCFISDSFVISRDFLIIFSLINSCRDTSLQPNEVTGVVVSGGSTQAEMTYSASKNVTDYIKIALKYKENDFELWIDGTLRATDTSGSVPASLSELAFDNGAGSNDFYGKCKDVRTYNTVLSDSELAEITG